MKTLSITALALLALLTPSAGLANITGTQTLSGNVESFSFDTGMTVASATNADVTWVGVNLAFANKATGYNLGPVGATVYKALTQSSLSVFGPLYSATSISTANLTVNDVFAVKTNGGNFAAALVTANSSGSLTFQFTTFTAGSSGGGPTITGVLNNFSFTPLGFPNSGIAPGSLFVIIGSGLADPAAKPVLQSSSGGGLPATLNGASVKVTVNGMTFVPDFYYATAAALALVLPSATPVGNAQVTVSYNGQTSAAFSVPVALSAMGFDTYYGTGTGLGVATSIVTGLPYNYSNSIPTGTTVTLWGSGLGADAARDAKYVPEAFPINNLAHVYIGGVDAPILYQGASGFPGVNQVNITIPIATPLGCNVALTGVTANGTPTNTVTLPIGNGACTDASAGAAGSLFQTLGGKSNIKLAVLLIDHATIQSPIGGAPAIVSDFASASFQNFGGAAFVPSTFDQTSGCTVTQTVSGATGTLNITGLDAGAVTIGTAQAAVALTKPPTAAPGVYFAQLPAGFITPTSSNFAFAMTGGADVGPFNTTVSYPTNFMWTNQAAATSVTRSAGLTITWTGGGGGFGSTVTITGASTSADGKAVGVFTCMSDTGAMQYTVPGYVVGALPAGTGTVAVNALLESVFMGPGIDFGLGLGEVSYNANATFK